MKYVILRCKYGEDMPMKEVPIIFPEFMVHALIVEGMEPVLKAHGIRDSKVISAGELMVSVDGCHGLSTSIKPNVSSRLTIDERLINSIDYTHGL